MANWQKVFSSKNVIQAEIVKGVLESRGLLPVLINKTDSSYNDSFEGECEIYIANEQVLKAIKIIQDEIRFE